MHLDFDPTDERSPAEVITEHFRDEAARQPGYRLESERARDIIAALEAAGFALFRP